MTVRSISLVVTESRSVVHNGVPAAQIKFELVNAVNISNRLFVVENSIVDGVPVAEYRTVATAGDLTNLSEDYPPDEHPDRPFRVSSIELTTDEPNVIDEFVTTVRRRLTTLLQTLQQLETVTTITHTISV